MRLALAFAVTDDPRRDVQESVAVGVFPQLLRNILRDRGRNQHLARGGDAARERRASAGIQFREHVIEDQDRFSVIAIVRQ